MKLIQGAYMLLLDHILPQAFTYYVYYVRGPFRSVCKAWVGLIGNLRAVPFEENRSDLAQTAAAKILGKKARDDSFLTEEQLRALGADASVCSDPVLSLAFISACRDRMIDIYREWYDTLGIATLTAAMAKRA